MCLRERRSSQHLTRSSSNEWEGDVELLVGSDPVWRFTAHRSVLAAASPVFEALFQGPLATKEPSIEIQDVDPRAFDFFLKFIYHQDCKLQNVSTALNVLYAGHRYLLTEVVEYCVKYLEQNLTVDTALTVFLHARKYCPLAVSSPPETPSEERKIFTPTAPIEEIDRPPETAGITGWSAVLLTNCLSYLDAHAEEILKQEEVEDVESAVLVEILSRDTLKSSELVVFNAVQRWSECECRRQRLVPTPTNRRHVLGDLLYHVRYPLLTSDEFIRGPLQSDLLSSEETKFFSALIAKSPIPPKPPRVERFLQQMHTYRVCPKSEISSTTELKQLVEPSRKSKSWRRSSKNKSAKLHTSGKAENKQSKCSGSCITDSIVDVLACIFD